MSMLNFMLSGVEHEKSCKASGPVFSRFFVIRPICGKICLVKEIKGGKSFNAREIS